jgi:hypothetical protein
MTSVVEVLNGQAPAGIYQAEHLDVEPIAHQALQRGWHCQVIDGSLIVDRHEALAAFGQVLDFLITTGRISMPWRIVLRSCPARRSCCGQALIKPGRSDPGAGRSRLG